MRASLRRLLLRLLNSLRPERAEPDLEREITTHLALLEDEFQRRGMTVEESRRAARVALGGVEQAKEMHREARSLAWADDAWRDLRYAARQLRRNPLFTLAATLSVAVGIGANTAIFTVVDALLLAEPAGVSEADRLVEIGVAREDGGFNPASYPTYLDVRQRATTLAGVYAHPMFPQPMSLGAEASAAGPERVFAQPVTASYFAVLGVVPALGRPFDAGDDEHGTSALVFLSHRFWERRLDADPGAVGRVLHLNGRPFTVVGVAPRGFQGTGVLAPDLWLPLGGAAVRDPRASVLANRRAGWLVIGGRLRPGVTAAQAAAEMDALGRALERQDPGPGGSRGLRLVPAPRLAGNSHVVGAFLALLTAVVAIVLVVACANLAGMLLARGAARRTEIAVRRALGAGRARLVRQLLLETTMLFLLGAAAALLVARGATSLIVGRLPALPFPIHVSLALDGRVIGFTIGLALVAALAFGLAPALQTSNLDVVAALKDDPRTASRRPTLRGPFLVAQVALSFLLVVVAGVFVRALQHAGAADPGFDPRGVDLVSLDVSMGAYTEATGPLLWRDLAERLRALPQVEAATVARVLPGGFEGIGMGGVAVRDAGAPAGQRSCGPSWNIVEPGYFATLRVPLLAGRDFTAADGPGAFPVAIVGEGVARRLWPGRSAVGQFMLHQAGPRESTLLVVGVVADVSSTSLIDGRAESFVYLPLQQHYAADMTSAMTIALRTRRGGRIADQVRSVVASVDPRLPVVRTQTLEDAVALGVVPQRLAVSLAGTLGAIGLVLAGLGLYGVTAYTVARRTREIGVRMALGARRRDIVRMVVGEGISIAAAGGAIGAALAAAARRALGAFLFDLPAVDPLPFVWGAIPLAVIAVLACFVPARAATKVDPLAALRYE